MIDALEEIVVTATLDVATLPTWSRGRTILVGDAAHATSPHAGQGASIALEDAYRLVCALQGEHETGIAFQNFERERRPRAERIVALARKNGNQKREFSTSGAWIRDRMIKVLMPFSARSWDWIYGYDPRAVSSPPQTSSRRDRQAA
jgi:2-polyprenyl-6-methoxyphenol hydroxylase-like FAD-dependent oxidoreductase